MNTMIQRILCVIVVIASSFLFGFSVQGQTHEVQRGEKATLIAKQYGVPFALFRKVNKLRRVIVAGHVFYKIHPKDVLVIPSQSEIESWSGTLQSKTKVLPQPKVDLRKRRVTGIPALENQPGVSPEIQKPQRHRKHNSRGGGVSHHRVANGQPKVQSTTAAPSTANSNKQAAVTQTTPQTQSGGGSVIVKQASNDQNSSPRWLFWSLIGILALGASFLILQNFKGSTKNSDNFDESLTELNAAPAVSTNIDEFMTNAERIARTQFYERYGFEPDRFDRDSDQKVLLTGRVFIGRHTEKVTKQMAREIVFQAMEEGASSASPARPQGGPIVLYFWENGMLVKLVDSNIEAIPYVSSETARRNSQNAKTQFFPDENLAPEKNLGSSGNRAMEFMGPRAAETICENKGEANEATPTILDLSQSTVPNGGVVTVSNLPPPPPAPRPEIPKRIEGAPTKKISGVPTNGTSAKPTVHVHHTIQ